jgi:hypothetical protein
MLQKALEALVPGISGLLHAAEGPVTTLDKIN